MNYMRSSMGAERQANLALIHIHYEQKIDLNEVVDIFAKLHPLRLQLQSIVKPAQDKQWALNWSEAHGIDLLIS